MLKLILADNQAIFRAGAAKVLAVEDEWRVVAQTQTFEQTLMALEKFRPNILICAAALHSQMSELVAAIEEHLSALIALAQRKRLRALSEALRQRYLGFTCAPSKRRRIREPRQSARVR